MVMNDVTCWTRIDWKHVEKIIVLAHVMLV